MGYWYDIIEEDKRWLMYLLVYQCIILQVNRLIWLDVLINFCFVYFPVKEKKKEKK